MNINEILELYFNEMMEDTPEGQLLKNYLEDKNSDLDRIQIQELFNNILYHSPDVYSYLSSVRDLFKDLSPFDRDEKLEEVFFEPYIEMIRKKFFEKINLKLNEFIENKLYIYLPNESEPTTVIFLNINKKYLNFCNFYDLKSDKVLTGNLTSLIPFDFDQYKKELKSWKIKYHRSVLDNLEQD